MTDRERFMALLDAFGVYYETSEIAKASPSEIEWLLVKGQDIHIPANAPDGRSQNNGYGGFFALAEFADDGSFKSMGFWE
jgi:hypothetical protein